jgi:hypothetical protein
MNFTHWSTTPHQIHGRSAGIFDDMSWVASCFLERFHDMLFNFGVTGWCQLAKALHIFSRLCRRFVTPTYVTHDQLPTDCSAPLELAVQFLESPFLYPPYHGPVHVGSTSTWHHMNQICIYNYTTF